MGHGGRRGGAASVGRGPRAAVRRRCRALAIMGHPATGERGSGMRRLSATDLQRVHDVLPLVYSDADEERFSGVAVEVVGRVLPHDVVSYNEIDVVRRQVRGLADPAETIWSADAPAIFDSHFDEHPSIRAVAQSGDGAPRRISVAL